jgi:fatty-acyl-CoA synthase
VSSIDLENALISHPSVQEAAVIAIPHPKWGERPLAIVVPASGERVTEDALNEHLVSRVAAYARPEGYVFVEELPRTSTGKVLKAALRERYKGWSRASC